MFSLLLVAQVLATAPPPPPVYVMIDEPQRERGRGNGERVRLGVVMRAGNTTMWDGTLWVSARNISSFRQSIQEAQPVACPRAAAYPYAAQNEVSVQLVPQGSGEASSLSVTARWVRPGEGACGGARTIELRETVPMPDAAATVLRGDAGLIVELRRR
ncbi:hypothetical protein [Sphingomonas sp. BK580]|uniref:hypothetical protein n=1 Tax=Sphingomonas sp. BK580 TaxID=2586972 RepID=UPI00161BBE0F|nr:hypothetical protein [Sphingomonas sp. BK580]MBB3692503.1 hypothetical protein [Sphingomonas sp. BK580]